MGDRITFADRFLSADQVEAVSPRGGSPFLMNYHSQYYETGAGSLAVGSGALVATSLTPQFFPFGDGGTSGFLPGT